MTLPERTKKQLLATQVALKRRQNNEAQLEKELGRFFKRLKKRVLKELNEYWSDYQLLQGQVNLMLSPVHEAHKEYYEIIRKYKLREYELGKAEAKRLTKRANKDRVALKATTTLGIKGFIDKDKNNLFGTIPKAEEDLLNRTFRTSQNTLNRVDNQLNQIISDGYREGKGINKVANDITQRFDQLATWEAKRIARTEINTSHNQATRDQYKEDGVEYTQWIAANDDRTRDSHVDVDGEIIPMGGKYSNGLEYPGDTNGPLEEWINCRCSNAPFVVPYGFMAPSFSPFREDDLVPVDRGDLLRELQEKADPQLNEPLNINETPVYTRTDISKYNGAEVKVYTYSSGMELRINEKAMLSYEEVTQHINSLPKPLQQIEGLNAINIMGHNHKNIGGHFIPMTNEVNLYLSGDKIKNLNNLNHELAHAYDYNKSPKRDTYWMSHVKNYEKIAKADNELYSYTNKRGQKRNPLKFPTRYAQTRYKKYDKEYRALKEFYDRNRKLYERKNGKEPPVNKKYVEDFAESTKLFLNPYEHNKFVKEFPNRAKYLEKIYGKPKFPETHILKKLIDDDAAATAKNILNEKEKQKRFDKLTSKQLNSELKKVLKNDDRVKTYYDMKETIRRIDIFDEAIYLPLDDGVKLMKKEGWTERSARAMLKNPNMYMNDFIKQQKELKRAVRTIEDLIKNNL